MQLNPLLVTSLAVAALVDIVAPVVLAVFLARRFHGRWRYWLYGLLVFLLSQGLTRVPAMLYFQTRPAVAEALKEPAWFWPFLVFAAFTAGLFEEGGRWLAFRWVVPPADRTWRNALMLGAGHGGLESIGIGLLTLLGLVGYLALALVPAESLGASSEQVEAARKQFAGPPSSARTYSPLAARSGWTTATGGRAARTRGTSPCCWPWSTTAAFWAWPTLTSAGTGRGRRRRGRPASARWRSCWRRACGSRPDATAGSSAATSTAPPAMRVW
jgi:hypothetical protein